MVIKLIPLSYNEGINGFDIQGLQKSKIFNGKSVQDIAIHSINSGAKRGGHFHKQKTEWLLPLTGKATFIWADKQNPENQDLKQFTIKADYKRPCVVEIPPMTLHWLKNDFKVFFVMMVFSSEDYDSQRPDTYKATLTL